MTPDDFYSAQSGHLEPTMGSGVVHNYLWKPNGYIKDYIKKRVANPPSTEGLRDQWVQVWALVGCDQAAPVHVR
jgi:hypothetical protein